MKLKLDYLRASFFGGICKFLCLRQITMMVVAGLRYHHKRHIVSHGHFSNINLHCFKFMRKYSANFMSSVSSISRLSGQSMKNPYIRSPKNFPESLDIDETDDMKLAEYFLMNLKQ